MVLTIKYKKKIVWLQYREEKLTADGNKSTKMQQIP